MEYNFFIKLTRLLVPYILISFVSRIFAFFFQNVKTHPGVIFDPRNKFEGNNVLLTNTKVYQSTIGKYTYISSNSLISRTKIGRYSSIGSWVSTGLGKHPKDFVSTHPLFHSCSVSVSLGLGSYKVGERFKTHKINKSGYLVDIGSDVWIGDRVIIMDGIEIGDGAIVGAGSIVTKNVKPYEIVAGSPAKHLKYRFLEDQINLLLSLKWWNKNESWIKKNAKLFTSINNFKIK